MYRMCSCVAFIAQLILIINITVACNKVNNGLTNTIDESSSNRCDITTLPAVNRPKGYDNPVLNEETALEILHEVRSLQPLIIFTGYPTSCLRWSGELENQIPGSKVDGAENCDYLNYFIPALDTMEKFDSYFQQVFTEDTLLKVKDELYISEYNGKLVGLNLYGRSGSTMLDWSRTTVSELVQNTKNSSAIVTVKTYIWREEEFYGYKDYTLIYSEEWGWRIDLESIADI